MFKYGYRKILLWLALTAFMVKGCPPVSAGEDLDPLKKAEQWKNRQSPEVIEALAKDFLDLVILDEEVMKKSGLSHRTGLINVSKLVKQGQYREALDQFEVYFLDKLRNPVRYGLHPADVSPYGEGVSGSGKYPTQGLRAEGDTQQAEALLKGHMGKDKIGLPGEVNWLYPHLKWSELRPAEPNGLPKMELLTAMAFNSLPQAYVSTGEKKYITAWVDYLDDWALNSQVTGEFPHPCFVPTTWRGSMELTVLVRILGGLAIAIPEKHQAELIPSATLARLLNKYWNEFILYQAMYLRTNTHNWTPGTDYMLLAMIFDEFKAAPLLFNEGRRRSVEDNAVTQNLRDGSENQQDPWYNENYEEAMSQLFPLFEARSKLESWKDLPWVNAIKNNPEWFQEIREHLKARISYEIHLQTPQGEWPIGVRGRDKRRGGNKRFILSPDAFADPANRSIVAAIGDACRLENHKVITPDSGLVPPYHSEWFPYGGYNLAREGWKADSGYGALFCSPAPGAYGGRRSRSNNNFFGMAAYGQDLIVEDRFDAYSIMGSPIQVDGLSQDFHAGLTRVPLIARHKMIPAVAWTEPAPWRWHASDNFNLMEGVYKGSYAKVDAVQMKPPASPVTMNGGSIPLAQTLQGIVHQRWVQYVRESKIWIVVDRLHGEGEHRYTQHWHLPLKPSTFPSFSENEIKIDDEKNCIQTNSSMENDKSSQQNQANVALYSFCKAKPKYSTKSIPKNKTSPYGQYSISLDWKETNDSLMVTAIFPRAPGLNADSQAVPLQITGPQGSLGFVVNLPSSGNVQYLAAPSGTPVTLSLGNVEVHGESLLVTPKGGMVLGCQKFSIHGVSRPIEGPDFEFTTLDNGQEKLTMFPIYRPISPVEIGPAQNIFCEQVEVTMTSKTQNCEIHYTLDGREPTPQSTLYSGPFLLSHNAIVKARAYRPGVLVNPHHQSGTEATPISRAQFSKKVPLKPVVVKKTSIGLSASYFEGDWRQMWLRLDSLKPVAQKSGVSAFDLSVIPDTNPPVGKELAPREKYFTVVYEGYLDIPETGVYTLHAPREFVMPDIDPGYQLRIFLGQNIVPYAYRTAVDGLNEWYPSTSLHAQGHWSVALEKGLQPFRIIHLDYRTKAPMLLNQPGLNEYIWGGVTPDIKISGPNMNSQKIPESWFKRG